MPLIENLQITNFKCFKQLEVKGLGQVNLIGGKNNMGKTAFLEAVELLLSTNKASDLAFMIYRLLKKRQNELDYLDFDFFYSDQKNIKIDSNLKCCQIEWLTEYQNYAGEKVSINEPGISTDILVTSVAKKSLISPLSMQGSFDGRYQIPIHYFSARFDSKNFPGKLKSSSEQPFYISPAKTREQEIAILLGNLTEIDKEDFLNQSLALFDKNVIAIKQVTTQNGVVLKLKIKDKKNLVLLSSLGEGINRYIAILCAIWANKDGFLLIDEIENGIHFTNYPKLWEIIFKTSVEANCQLFITTHSKECITAFNDMQFEVDTCNAQYFELYRNQKTDLITSFARDKDQLRYALTHEGKVRGE